MISYKLYSHHIINFGIKHPNGDGSHPILPFPQGYLSHFLIVEGQSLRYEGKVSKWLYLALESFHSTHTELYAVLSLFVLAHPVHRYLIAPHIYHIATTRILQLQLRHYEVDFHLYIGFMLLLLILPPIFSYYRFVDVSVLVL